MPPSTKRKQQHRRKNGNDFTGIVHGSVKWRARALARSWTPHTQVHYVDTSGLTPPRNQRSFSSRFRSQQPTTTSVLNTNLTVWGAAMTTNSSGRVRWRKFRLPLNGFLDIGNVCNCTRSMTPTPFQYPSDFRFNWIKEFSFFIGKTAKRRSLVRRVWSPEVLCCARVPVKCCEGGTEDEVDEISLSYANFDSFSAYFWRCDRFHGVLETFVVRNRCVFDDF